MPTRCQEKRSSFSTTLVMTFSTGFSLAVYTFFLWWTDQRGRQWPVFRTLGVNALAGYVLHMLVDEAVLVADALLQARRERWQCEGWMREEGQHERIER